MAYIGLFLTHLFGALFLFICIPLPFLYYAARLDEDRRFLHLLLKGYQVVLAFAQISLVVLMATGIPLIQDWGSWWTWTVIVLTVWIGGSAAFSAKAIQRLRVHSEDDTASLRLRKASLVLSVGVLAMLLLKYGRLFM